MPLIIVFITPESALVASVSAISLIFLALLGVLSANVGGSSMIKGAVRVSFWGALAMGLTALVGALFGTIV
jgi:VIT1/CCC1 family predicted Fe2+/Mn2+ transporter